MTLPYWIEKGTNTVWTKVNIPANSSVVLTVKKNGMTQPNPDDVFLFFDDFEGNELDINKWSSLPTDVTLTVANGYLSITGSNYNSEIMVSSYQLPSECVVEFRKSIIIGSGTLNGGWDFRSSLVQADVDNSAAERIASSTSYYVDIDGDASNGVSFVCADGEWYKEIYKQSYTSVTVTYISNSQTITLSKTASSNPDFITLRFAPNNKELRLDYVFVRKYADQEPTIQIEQVASDEYRVKITNPNSYDLTDFQVGFKIGGITDSDILDISYYMPEGKQITYDEVSNTIIVVGGTEDNPVSFTDLIIADDNNGWGVIDTGENGNYVIDATIQVGDGITQTYFKTVNSTLLFTVYGTDYPLLNVKQNADCVLENTKIATLSQLDSIYEQLENIRNEISEVNSDLDSIKTDIDSINNTLSNLKVDLPESIKQMIAYIFNAVKRLGI